MATATATETVPHGDVDMEGVALSASDDAASKRLPVIVQRPIPYTFDLGNLLANDASPLPPNPTEQQLASAARDAAQSLINQLLTTCPIVKTSDGVALTLPTPSTPLPREKAVPTPKEPTKWDKFATRKGIKAKRRDERKNMVFDEEKQDWVPKWGYKGKNKDGEDDWLVEVDDKKERKTGEPGDARKESREERKEKARRQERRQRANERRAVKGTGG